MSSVLFEHVFHVQLLEPEVNRIPLIRVILLNLSERITFPLD